jgi:hypothetical protein
MFVKSEKNIFYFLSNYFLIILVFDIIKFKNINLKL